VASRPMGTRASDSVAGVPGASIDMPTCAGTGRLALRRREPGARAVRAVRAGRLARGSAVSPKRIMYCPLLSTCSGSFFGKLLPQI
jgi:hypothetical protein